MIPNPAEDICNECFKYAKQHKFALTERVNIDDNDNEDDEVRTEREIARQQEKETMVLQATLHVSMAQTQRQLYQAKKLAAMETKDNRPSERVLCFVGDYAQNLYIPNFASEKPGDTYYFSPLACYCFGMVDCSTMRLAAMMYTEEYGKKGGNNVALL